MVPCLSSIALKILSPTLSVWILSVELGKVSGGFKVAQNGHQNRHRERPNNGPLYGAVLGDI